jgi:hypothetical protein
MLGGGWKQAVQTQYQARPGRRALVVTDLALLRGPAQGTIEDGQRTLMVASIRYLDDFVKQDG